MQTSIQLVHRGRHLQIKAAMIAGDWQIWIHEGVDRLYLHGIVMADQEDQLEAALELARRDVETETIIVPILRFWPLAGSQTDAR